MIAINNNGFELKKEDFNNIKKWNSEFYFEANEIIQELKDLFYETLEESEKEERIISIIEEIESDINGIILEVKLAKRKHQLSKGFFQSVKRKEINIEAFNKIKSYFDRIDGDVLRVKPMIKEIEKESKDEYDASNEVVKTLKYFGKLIPMIKNILKLNDEESKTKTS